MRVAGLEVPTNKIGFVRMGMNIVLVQVLENTNRQKTTKSVLFMHYLYLVPVPGTTTF